MLCPSCVDEIFQRNASLRVYGVSMVFRTFPDQEYFPVVRAVFAVFMREVGADGRVSVSESSLADTVMQWVTQNVVEQYSLSDVAVDRFTIGVVFEEGACSFVSAVEITGVGQFYLFNAFSRVGTGQCYVCMGGHDRIRRKDFFGFDYSQCYAVLKGSVVLIIPADDFIFFGMEDYVVK